MFTLPSVLEAGMQKKALQNLSIQLDKRWGQVLQKKVSLNVIGRNADDLDVYGNKNINMPKIRE